MAGPLAPPRLPCLLCLLAGRPSGGHLACDRALGLHVRGRNTHTAPPPPNPAGVRQGAGQWAGPDLEGEAAGSAQSPSFSAQSLGPLQLTPAQSPPPAAPAAPPSGQPHALLPGQPGATRTWVPGSSPCHPSAGSASHSPVLTRVASPTPAWIPSQACPLPTRKADHCACRCHHEAACTGPRWQPLLQLGGWAG